MSIDYDYIPLWNAAEISFSDDASDRSTERENSTRPAVAEATQITTGVGQQRIKTPITFPVIFIEQPHVSTGSVVLLNGRAQLWHDPVASSGIYQWVVDSRQYYTGAYVFVRVDAFPMDTDTTGPPPAIKMEHHFTFAARAVKDLSSLRGGKSVSKSRPRAVGI